MKKMGACLWFDHQAEDAAKLYGTIFDGMKTGKIARYGKSGAEVSGQSEGKVMTVEVEIEGLPIVLLNGGPIFKITPALSFFLGCRDEDEVKRKWEKLSEGGQVIMGLDKYPWSPMYGWCADKFGVQWQLTVNPGGTRIAPAFLFVDALFGKGEEAINHYTSIFPDSKVDSLERAQDGKSVMFSSFTLSGTKFVLMDGSGKHGWTFTEGASIMIPCRTQEEIDRYSAKLSEGGSLQPCGWVKDKFGVSWQVAPANLDELMSNPATAEKVAAELYKMKKIDIATLEKAAKS